MPNCTQCGQPLPELQAPVDFRALFGQFGVFSPIPKKVPKRTSITTYNATVESQIKRLTTLTPACTGDWFKVQPNGEVTVSLRFRGRIMPLVDGSNVMKLPSREVAVAYLHATIDAATAGLFDAVFEEVLNTKKWPWYNPKTWEPERAKTPEEMEATTAMVQRQYQALKERYLQPAVRKGSATL